MSKFITPFVYLIFVVAVCVELIFSISIIEKMFGLHSIWGHMGDIDALLVLMFFGGATFIFANIFVSRCDGISSVATPKDHFRQSVLLYVFLGLFSPAALPFLGRLILEENFNPGLGGWMLAMIYVVAIYGVIINAAFLYFFGKRGTK